MKPFNLEEAKAGAPVCTRDGKDVVIIDYNYKCAYDEYDGNILLIGKVLQKDGTEEAVAYYQDGRERKDGHNSRDLFMKTQKFSGFCNVYKSLGRIVRGSVFENEDAAKKMSELADFDYVATAKIEWEE